MLRIHESAQISRRELLRIGGLGLGGLSLGNLLASRAGASEPAGGGDKSVIFIFQQGGPPQFETYDPKPNAPAEVRTVTGIAQTTIPGVHFGETFARLSQLAHKLTIVRSFQTENGGHNIRPLVGPESLNTNVGAIAARVLGATHPATGMPRNALLLPQSVCADVTRGQGARRSVRNRRGRSKLCTVHAGRSRQPHARLAPECQPRSFCGSPGPAGANGFAQSADGPGHAAPEPISINGRPPRCCSAAGSPRRWTCRAKMLA